VTLAQAETPLVQHEVLIEVNSDKTVPAAYFFKQTSILHADAPTASGTTMVERKATASEHTIDDPSGVIALFVET